MRGRMGTQGSPVKSYDYLLKFLLVGDSDVGKGEILESLQDGASESPYAYSNGIDYKTTTILLDGRRVKLELWDTSGQGRFCTIFRSYSRGAQSVPKIGVAPTCVFEADLKLEQLNWNKSIKILNSTKILWSSGKMVFNNAFSQYCCCSFSNMARSLQDKIYLIWKTLKKIPLLLDTGSLRLYVSLLSVPVSWEIPSLWETFTCAVDIRSTSPGVLRSPCVLFIHGILLVYDITNRWSFDGIDRWIKEIDEHAPGVPRILVGNRLHLAFKRQVPTEQARAYAEKNCMTFFEVSPLCNFNVIESFTELSRIVLMRHGMEKIWRPNRVFSLQDLCCRAIVSCTPVHLIDKLPLPVTIKSHLKSFSMANGMNAVMMHGRSYSLASSGGGSSSKGNSLKRSKSIRPPQSPPQNCSRNNCKIS
ncbi:hypothetical protein IHE44_0004392 [Lamprotornis superbus]|uniref:small monomeric GTPase n=1 Tax=Lamprotornis superbus TaxID=245042 RepID=A0A835NKS4_9PASS|nr:hypothetical protein IHE44_0004392 [Lamprotornis superbus]